MYSNLDATPIKTRDYVIQAKERESEKLQQQKTLTQPQKAAQLSDPETTFSYCYLSPNGQGSRNIYRMVQHAKDLGASKNETIQLIHDVNEYWSMDKGAMPAERVEKLVEQAERLF
jgi:hypothetical protein